MSVRFSAFIVGAAVLCFGSVVSATSPLRLVSSSGSALDAEAVPSAARKAGVVSVCPVSVDASVFAGVRAGSDASVELAVAPDTVLRVRFDRFDNRSIDDFTAFGHLADVPNSTVVATFQRQVFVASITAPGIGRFDIRQDAAGRLVARKFDESKLAADYCGATNLAPPVQARGAAPVCPVANSSLARYSADDGSMIDIMVVYTAAARDAAGGVPQIDALITQAASIANQAYTNSNVNPRVRIVHTALISYTESGVYATDLPRLVNPSDGFLDSVHPDRDTYGADLVYLFVNNLDSGGAAFSLAALGPDDDGRSTFGVMRQDNAPFETLAHECGHNFGCQHDRLTSPTGGFFNYSYGYREPGNLWKTIMAYPPGTNILYFSNPNLNYNGPLGDPGPMGVPGDDPNSSCNNALTHNNTAFTIANFRPSTLVSPPPSRLYVRAAAAPGGDGSSWAAAIQDLQIGIGKAAASRGVVTEVWVAAGTYKPNRGQTNPLFVRNLSFRPINGVSIYGGFNGTETLLTQRNIAANVTTLSGDIGVSGDNSDNSYHVVDGTGLNSTAILDGFTITAGNANDGYPHESGGGYRSRCSGATIRNCRFTANNATIGGGASDSDGSNTQFVSCSFDANTADALGGAASTYQAAPAYSGCTFTNNTAANDYGAVNCELSDGATFNNCTFTSNMSPWGGAFGSWNASPTLTQCSFNTNAALGNGGGGFIAGGTSPSSPTLNQCTFTGNTATFGGGAYCHDGANAHFTNCTFTNNSGSNDAGGVWLYAASPVFSGCTFTTNTGGSIANISGTSGAIGMSNGSQPQIVGCTFDQNHAGWRGGGVVCYTSTPTIRDCTFTGNTAKNGAGLWIADQSPAVITNCRFFGNMGEWGGAGVFVTDSSTPVLTNCVFSGNTSTDGYGATAEQWAGAAATFVNCTASNNAAQWGGGGIWNDASTATIKNCIFWQNTDPSGSTESSQITNWNGSSSTVNYSIIHGLTGGLGGTGNLGSNPQFTDPDGADNVVGTIDDNLRPLRGSPAIDSGQNAAVPVGVTTDVAGNPRFANDPCAADTGVGTPPIVDRGAYEFIPLAAILGDIDNNGLVNNADIPGFVNVLRGTDVNAQHVAAADMNCDTLTNGRDIQPFVQRLLLGP